MKLQPIAFLLFSGLLASCDDDVLPEKVPLEVRQNLLDTFPQAYDIEWEKSGKEYEAEFAVQMAEHSALFRAAGTLLQYKRQISPATLPDAVRSAIANHYGGYSIEEAEEFVKYGDVAYQVELKSRSAEAKVVFSASGQQLRQPFWD